MRNYLRVRGEYVPPVKWFGWNRELPPRARRIQEVNLYHHIKNGTTSACAENTKAEKIADAEKRNYLRVRGEYVMTAPARTSR